MVFHNKYQRSLKEIELNFLFIKFFFIIEKPNPSAKIR